MPMATFKSYKQDASVDGIESGSLIGNSRISMTSSGTSKFTEELQARGIYDRTTMGWTKAFSRVPIIDPYNVTTNTYEYVFFTKPDLHLLENGSPNTELTNRSSFFADAIDRYPHIVSQLQFSSSMGTDGGTLCPLLSNAMNGNLELPSINSENFDTAQNVFGTKMEYRGSSYKSDEGFDFSIEFKDTKYLEVYMWLKMYDEYEKMKMRGQVSPTLQSYIINKILHDQIAIYKFIVGDDGMSLIYWARIMGAFPTSVPRDTFGSKIEGEISYSVSWHGQFVSDMDPGILTDFNNITAPYRGTTTLLPLYDSTYHRFKPDWAKSPVIGTRNGTTTEDKLNKYYLLWSA